MIDFLAKAQSSQSSQIIEAVYQASPYVFFVPYVVEKNALVKAARNMEPFP
ncbi:MAG: hypothetical protein JWP12_1269 [Bacteroidetes bacterium]|nr:hypothetical protein [Bacteroidota bacterium]